MAFDRPDGTLWVGDVGEAPYEEVNQVQAGANYGWPLQEGNQCRATPDARAALNSATPLAVYAHTYGQCAVIGDLVYRGAALPWGTALRLARQRLPHQALCHFYFVI